MRNFVKTSSLLLALVMACAGKFSSDRTIRQYAEEIWHIKPTQY